MWWQGKDDHHIISECIKLAQKEYGTKQEWIRKVIHWELCKKLKFDHTTGWCMYKPESVIDDECHETIWDFETQTDHLMSARWLDLMMIT